MQSTMPKKPINRRRRNIIKLGLLGVGAFVLGKIFGPSIDLFSDEWDGQTFDFKNFRVVENSQGLAFFDKVGNEILVLENDPNDGR